MKRIKFIMVLCGLSLSGGLYSQNYDLEELEEGTYYIQVDSSSRYLDVRGSCEMENGCQVQLYGLGRSDKNNKFIFEKVGYRKYLIHSYASGKVVEAKWETIDQYGGDVQLWDHVPIVGDIKGNQVWNVVQLSRERGIYKIFIDSLKCMAVSSAGMHKNKTKVKIYPMENNGTEYRVYWKLIRLDKQESNGSSERWKGKNKEKKSTIK